MKIEIEQAQLRENDRLESRAEFRLACLFATASIAVVIIGLCSIDRLKENQRRADSTYCASAGHNETYCNSIKE